jgi:hypothetical protein
VTAKVSAAFCAKVAAAKAKIEAAKERDRIDAELAKLPAPTTVANGERPVSDPYIANTRALLKEAGFNPSERLIKAEEAMSRALGFELVAALGPTCWLAFVNMMALSGAHVSASIRERPRNKFQAPGISATAPVGPRNGADDYDRAIADLFEEAPAGAMKAKDIRPLVRAWFDAKGKSFKEAELWARLGQKFQRDANNGRPRYIGLKPRIKAVPPRRWRTINRVNFVDFSASALAALSVQADRPSGDCRGKVSGNEGDVSMRRMRESQWGRHQPKCSPPASAGA